jgi:hypothetical protein
VVHESFLHLSESQRAEIFEALHAELMKPENAAVRAPTIEHFTLRALQVRAAQARLAEMSSTQKKVLASQFGKEAKALSEEDQGQLREVLERGLLPVPQDLNQLFLTSLN